MKKQHLLAAFVIPVFLFVSNTTPEFWIHPSITHAVVGQRIPLQLSSGENFSGSRWTGNGNRILSYNHYFRNQQQELLLALEPGDNLVNLPDLIPSADGTHMLTLFTNDKFREVSADDFNNFLKDHGHLIHF